MPPPPPGKYQENPQEAYGPPNPAPTADKTASLILISPLGAENPNIPVLVGKVGCQGVASLR
jgi:hypothetical protein